MYKRQLIDRLVARHDVERVDGVDLDPDIPDEGWAGSPATKLTPHGAGSPLTFTFTPFPGVGVRFGHAGHAMFPSCGCDACDDDPVEESDDLAEVVAVVIAGGFRESRHRPVVGRDRYETVLQREDGTTRSIRSIDRRDLPSVPLGTTTWAPWSDRR